jgi:hypothetical protein
VTPLVPRWISGTPLAVEHEKLMAARHKPIPWDASTADRLSAPEREIAASIWRKRIENEYLAISTFAVLSIDLCAARAPADVLSLTHRAAIDEVRHAEYCCRLASIYSGRDEEPEGGLSDLPDEPARPKREQALANALLVSCVAETYATVVLNAVRPDATDPVVAAVLANIYADELVHARIGWAYLAHCLQIGGDGEREAAAGMIPVAIRGAANVIESPDAAATETIGPALRAHGLMPASEGRELFRRCVDEVLLPGFRELGIRVEAPAEFDEAWVRAAG